MPNFLRISLLLVAALILFSCGKERILKTEKDESGHVVVSYEVDEKTGERDGACKEFYQSGKLLAESSYKAGKLEGVRRIYHESGKLDAEEQYEGGIFSGPYRKYFADGRLQQEGLYRQGSMEGEWKTYYSSGKLKEIVYFRNNLENGPFVEYYENGNKKAEGHFQDGDQEQGELKLYGADGNLIRKMNCERGICTTLWAADTLKK